MAPSRPKLNNQIDSFAFSVSAFARACAFALARIGDLVDVGAISFVLTMHRGDTWFMLTAYFQGPAPWGCRYLICTDFIALNLLHAFVQFAWPCGPTQNAEAGGAPTALRVRHLYYQGHCVSATPMP